MKSDMVKRLLKLEDKVRTGKESDIEKEMKTYAEVFRRKSDLSDAEIAARERSRAEHEDDDPAMGNYNTVFSKEDSEEKAKEQAEIERLRLEHEAEEERKRQAEIAEREKLEHEHKEYTEMLKRGPDDKKLIRAPFGKELVKDDKGNLFWRTVIDLSQCEIGPAVDPLFQEALESC